MKAQALLIVAAGLLLGAYSPRDDGAKQPKEEPYYIKVDVRGVLMTRGIGGDPLSIFLPRQQPDRPKGKYYPLDVSKLKDWTEQKLLGFNGKTVHVTGTLEYLPVVTRPGVTEERLTIIAKTLKFVEDKDDPAIKQP